MKMRTWAGAVAAALVLAGCGGSAVEPEIDGPRMNDIELPLDDTGAPIETDTLKGGYFGSGHTQPPPRDTTLVPPG